MKKIILFLSIIIFAILILCNEVSIDSIYDKRPDIEKSYEGILKESEKTKVLNYLNYVRKLHGLKPVLYNPKADLYTAKASLIMAANNTLTHTPTEKMKCWTKEGAEGAKQSNLAIFDSSDFSLVPKSERSIDLWLKDTNVESLGHRRWILDPFLKYVSFGRVDGKPLVPSRYSVSASVLYVINNEQNDISDMDKKSIEYPIEDYPSELFDKSWYLSFSVIQDKKNKWNNSNVSFKNSKITMKDDNGRILTASSIKDDYNGYGLPNILMWKAAGLKDNVKYMVAIEKISVGSEIWNMIYHFTLKK